MRILVGIPSGGNVEPECLIAAFNADRCGHDLIFDISYGYEVDVNRNRLAKKAIDEGFDYVLFLDSDVILPQDALRNLLDPQADIVMGCYRSKPWISKGKYTQLHEFGDTINYVFENCITSEMLDGYPEDRHEIKGGGAGCLLVRADALKRIEKPWFHWHVYKDGSTLSEDLWFCEQTRKAGFKIYLDRRVRCGHRFKSTHWC